MALSVNGYGFQRRLEYITLFLAGRDCEAKSKECPQSFWAQSSERTNFLSFDPTVRIKKFKILPICRNPLLFVFESVDLLCFFSKERKYSISTDLRIKQYTSCFWNMYLACKNHMIQGLKEPWIKEYAAIYMLLDAARSPFLVTDFLYIQIQPAWPS